jgi:hypothetical protein
MKKKIHYLGFFLLFIALVGCKNTEEKSANSANEIAAYACPMDCEDGKHYTEEGTCPVCNMHLKLSEDSMKCTVHKDGECKCDSDKCKCENCKEHNT